MTALLPRHPEKAPVGRGVLAIQQKRALLAQLFAATAPRKTGDSLDA